MTKMMTKVRLILLSFMLPSRLTCSRLPFPSAQASLPSKKLSRQPPISSQTSQKPKYLRPSTRTTIVECKSGWISKALCRAGWGRC